MAALEYKQRTLARIVDVGTDLFSITACAAKAGHLIRQGHNKTEVMKLMHAYFTFARQRIDTNFGLLWKSYDKEQRSLSKDVLADRVLWLEEGVMPQNWEGEIVNDRVTKGTIETGSQTEKAAPDSKANGSPA